MLLGRLRAGGGATTAVAPRTFLRKHRKPRTPPVHSAPDGRFDLFATAANPLGTKAPGAGASPDVAVLHWKHHLLHKKTLESANLYSRRTKDDKNVLMVEFDNFGDLGTNLPASSSGAVLPPPMFVLLGAGGAACLWFGAKPAYEDAFAGIKNLRRLHTEQRQLRQKYQDAVNNLLQTDASRNLTRDQRRELLNLSVWLSLSLEESTSEKVERIISGFLVGPGATLTGIGTFLQPGFIFGHVASLATVSQLFTGWVGNGPIAVFGLINAISSARNWHRAHQHLRVVRKTDLNKTWPGAMDINKLVQDRQRLIKNNAVLTGVSSFGIGVGGILTCINLAGYGVLLFFAALRAGAEYRERRKIAYTRRLFIGQNDYTTRRDLLSDLIYCQKNHDVLKKVKNHVRERYPWGYSAPQPFNWFVRTYAKVRNHRRKFKVPAAVHVQAAAKALRRSQIEWLQRKLQVATAEHARLSKEKSEAGATTAHDVKLRQQDALMQRLQVRIDFMLRDREALKRDNVMAMYTSQGHAWVERMIHLFVEMQQFSALAKEMYKNPLLLHPIRHAVTMDGKKNIVIDAGQCIEKLRHRNLNVAWYEAFYGVCEELLLTNCKLYFQELARELSDMVVLRLWLSRHPEKSPFRKVTPKPAAGARAIWSPPTALPHPAGNVVESFVPQLGT